MLESKTRLWQTHVDLSIYRVPLSNEMMIHVAQLHKVNASRRAITGARWSFCIAVLLSLCTSLALSYGQTPPSQRHIAIAVAANTGKIYACDAKNSKIDVLDSNGITIQSIQGDWHDVCDMAVSADGQTVAVVTQSPPRLILINRATEQDATTIPIDLPGLPARVLLCDPAPIVCLTMPWKQGVCIVDTSRSPTIELSSIQMIATPFPPKEMVLLSSKRILIADAFGDQLAVLDLDENKVVSTHRILGHHIAGMALDSEHQSVLITHQRLSSHAETSRDDIHWGNLIQNRVTEIPIASFNDTAASDPKRFRSLQLDDTGHGAGDPAGIVVNRDDYVVAISGTNQIAYRPRTSNAKNQAQPLTWRFIDVGTKPTRVVRIEDRRFACLNEGDGTISIFESSAPLWKQVHRIGEPRPPEGPLERGRQYFFSAKLSHDGWMSCSSCHVDAHSPDLLVDTLGDGQFGNAKRIPSLFYVGSTGPWGWHGNQPTLKSQIVSTLNGTMHRNAKPIANAATNEEIASDIADYLQSLTSPPDSPLRKSTDEINQPSPAPADADEIVRGSARFSEWGCAKCHDPNIGYTTPAQYLLPDKLSAAPEEFNPPTLRGVSHRRRYFHDGRFGSLDELVRQHPEPNASHSIETVRELIAFLRSL